MSFAITTENDDPLTISSLMTQSEKRLQLDFTLKTEGCTKGNNKVRRNNDRSPILGLKVTPREWGDCTSVEQRRCTHTLDPMEVVSCTFGVMVGSLFKKRTRDEPKESVITLSIGLYTIYRHERWTGNTSHPPNSLEKRHDKCHVSRARFKRQDDLTVKGN